MADVQARQEHSLGAEAAVERMKQFEDTLRKYGVKARWHDRHADLKGLGVSGRIEVTDTHVDVTLQLGMLAKAAGIDGERLARSMTRRLGAALRPG